jgi:uncharacterized protein (DUF1810 family)
MRRRRSFLRYLSSCKPGENAATEMWFVFPQLRRLGRSSDGIGSLGAAQTSLACLSPVRSANKAEKVQRGMKRSSRGRG